MTQIAEPSPGRDERALLRRTLDAQRAHVLGMLEGLSESDLHRAVLPSGWSCLGLVQHLALDVERFWFSQVVAGEVGAGIEGRDAKGTAETVDAWQVGPDRAAGEILDLYRQEARRADAVIDETRLDAAPRWWPEDRFGSWRLHDLREILLHVVTETACHAGHLDATRELIDGRRWLVLTS